MVGERLLDELGSLREEYPGLGQKVCDGLIVLRGDIEFCLSDANTRKPAIAEQYSVEITISAEFPAKIPTVRETGGKIARSYEHVSPSGVLCLGIPSELQLLLKKYPTIKGFVEHIVTPNLFAYSFYKRYGFMPWGERAAGRNGIYLRYAELFRTADVAILLALLDIVLQGNYQGNSQCPCGSTRTLNECHGEAVHSLWQIPWEYVMSDHRALQDFKLDIDMSGLVYRKYSIV